MSLFSKLKKSFSNFSNSISSLFAGNKIDAKTISELEDILISSDVGLDVTKIIIDQLTTEAKSRDLTNEEIKQIIASIITDILNEVCIPFTLKDNQLNIILLCGVNGNGKTTSIGKLASLFKASGKKVMIAACDTFRAAAVSQLEVWAERAGVEILIGAENQDPASVAYKATEKALADKCDVLLIDTAGRLNNKSNLMQELEKIVNVTERLQKIDYKLLVVGATTGQSINTQASEFNKFTRLNGLILTKLDGTAKGGSAIASVRSLRLPIYFIGVGEAALDLEYFDAKIFTEALVGLSNI